MSFDDEEGRLGIVEPTGYAEEWRIGWFFADDNGSVLGDCGKSYTTAQLAAAKPDERYHIIATMTAKTCPGVERDRNGFYWTSRKAAAGALRVIKAAIKADGGAPWPAWTKEAIAAGWKAPKGWKP